MAHTGLCGFPVFAGLRLPKLPFGGCGKFGAEDAEFVQGCLDGVLAENARQYRYACRLITSFKMAVSEI